MERRLCETARHARQEDADGPLFAKKTGRSSLATCAFKLFGRSLLKWEATFIFMTTEVLSLDLRYIYSHRPVVPVSMKFLEILGFWR